MAERPKFRRKKRMQVEEISDVLPQRLPQTQTDSDPIAPLETREERLARRAAKASDEQRLAKEALRRGVEARAEARRRAEQEDMAQAAAQRAAAARLAQRQQADAEARRTAETEAATKAQEDQDRAKAAAAAREAKAYDQLVKEQEHKAKTLAAERKARIAEASRKAAQQRAEAKRRAEEEETIRAEKAKRAEAEAKAKAEARAQEAREKAEALAHAKAEEDAGIEAEEQARTEAEAEAEERAAEKLRRKAQRRAEEAERREQVDMAARPARKAPTPEEPLTLTNPVMPVAEQAAERTESAPVPEPAPEAMSAPPQTLAQTWAGMSEFTLDERHLERNRIITAGRNDPAHAAFDVLRTRLLQALAERGWSRVAITSRDQGLWQDLYRGESGHQPGAAGKLCDAAAGHGYAPPQPAQGVRGAVAGQHWRHAARTRIGDRSPDPSRTQQHPRRAQHRLWIQRCGRRLCIRTFAGSSDETRAAADAGHAKTRCGAV